MAPNALTTPEDTIVEDLRSSEMPKMKFAWKNIIFVGILHALALHGFFLLITGRAKIQTTLLAVIIGQLGSMGITAGVHRLWSHRSYKARLPLRTFLMLLNCLAFQGDIHEWARDHRVHHKHSETNADPYNAKRGFFFSHIGWVMVKKHPDVKGKGKTLDDSDLLQDPVVQFQRRYYYSLVILMSVVVPAGLPMILYNETFSNSMFIAVFFRYCVSLHLTWFVNSAAHMWGNRPYNKEIEPRENIWVAFGSMGEGYHNYHHTFPWDYSTSEYGFKFNPSSLFIDCMAMIGQAYDLRRVSPEIIEKRKQKSGEHTHVH